MSRIILAILTSVFLFSCNNSDTNSTSESAKAQAVVHQNEGPKNPLGPYWYQSKAEISRYTLQQNRYKDVHPGEAILIFVTEDFLTDKQVKNDYYQNPNSIPILKNNRVVTFPTGLYNYSLMTSVFTPAEINAYPQTLKVTTSSQEWCGQTFMQINATDKHYDVSLNSYFEGEADQKFQVDKVVLEDELFNRIRMTPEQLPQGELSILPSASIARLLHLEFQPLQANASLTNYKGKDFEDKGLMVYTIKYPSLNRELAIIFEKEAPYKIEGWIDAYPSVFDKKVRKTVAKRTHTILSDYWSKNALADMKLRPQLGLDRAKPPISEGAGD